MPKAIQPRFCKVHDHINYEEFGAEPGYFDKWIKDQHLIIIDDSTTFLQVKSADGAIHSAHHEDVTIVEAAKEPA